MSWRLSYSNVMVSALLGLVLVVVGIGWLPVDMGRPQGDRAPVMLDGRRLFFLEGIDGFSAQRRANITGDLLADAVMDQADTDSPRSPRVWISQRNSLITLRLQGHHLLTVTDADARMGVDNREQARVWASTLESALIQALTQRSPPYRQRALVSSLVAAASAIAGALMIRVWQRSLVRRERGSKSSLWAVKIVVVLMQFGLWAASIFYITEQFPETRIWRYRILQVLGRTFTEPLFTVEGKGYSLLDTLNLLALALGLWLIVRGLTLFLTSQLRQGNGQQTLQDALSVFLQVILTGLGLVVLLQAVGVDISSLAILASVLGVGIGFGLQNVANNFISGVIILLERPIQVGDFVNLGDLVGTVERIGARSTEIRTLDLVTIIVPNSEFIQSKVINWSHGHPLSRLHIPLGVAYGTAIKQLRTAALEAARTHPEVLRFPKPQLWFQGFGDSALDFDLLVWVREPRHQNQVRSDLYYLLEANLRRYNIEIPFPQHDVHLRLPPGSEDTSSQVEAIETVLSRGGAPVNCHSPVPNQSNDSTIPMDVLDDLSDLADCSLLIRQQESLSESDIRELVVEMRSTGGIDRRDRRYHLRLFKQCFVGSEAVTWLVQTQKTTREQAVTIGQMLVDRCIVHHVTDEHPFIDDYLFYRFYDDEHDND
ncbi:MAG: mechanosensitive ion channel domain-containing protein [Elainellaceae cyanobacterium]